jgi:hypothetical protein
MKIKSNPFNRLGHASTIPGGSQISSQLAYKCGKVVTPKHRLPIHPGNILCIQFCWRLSRPHGHIMAGRISDTVGNRTRNLPACSAVPQTTEPTHALSPTMKINFKN